MVSQRVVFVAGPMVGDDFSDIVVASVPAAAAVDVFIRYRDPDGVVTNPHGTEVWKVFAVQNEIRSQIGRGKASTEAGKGSDGVPVGRIAAVRDVPAESLDITLSAVGLTVGQAVYFDLVIISWGSEPTGIGPFELATVYDGQPLSLGDGQKTGLIPIVKTAGGWRALEATSAGAVKVNLVGYGGAGTATRERTSNSWAASWGSAAGRLMSVAVSSKAPAAGWIFIFDAAALPANGALPDYPPIPIPIGNAGGAFVSVDFSAFGGLPTAAGIRVAFSSTQDVLTLGSSDCWIEIDHIDGLGV